MHVPRTLCAASLLLSLSACGEDDRTVPFGLERGADTPSATPPREPARFEPRVSGDLPRGERRRVVSGAELSTTELELGSILELDIDADDDTDALVVLRSDTVAELALASREGQRLTLSSLSRVTIPEGCTAAAGRIEQPAARSAVARLSHVCENGPSETIWALELARRPRVRETIRALPPAEGDSPLALTTAVRDIDGDGREDFEARVALGAAAPIALAWLDRPGGFGLNREEPSASLRRMMTEAEALLASAPDQGLAKASEALALHR
ncbi:MAG: hypothetical protein H5U40_01930, partial [Polyangiaceae bacterium]|nr:hypothetical protein [Polyangiaceae bacterium]